MDSRQIHTEILVDLIGPIIDISKIASFQEIPGVRYLDENEIAVYLTKRFSVEYSTTTVGETINKALKSKSPISLLDKESLRLLLRAKKKPKYKSKNLERY